MHVESLSQHARRFARPAAAFVVASLTAAAATAGDWSGQLALEGRAFFSDGGYPGQHGNNLSAFAKLEYYHDWDDGDQRFAMTPFVRADQGDAERSHADFRELYWRKSFAAAELSIGLRKVFWGVTESRHLVDIVNQTDFVEDVDTEDKLGQPMVLVSLLKDFGTFDLYVMPYFRERTFAGRKGRPRPRVPVDSALAVYESGAGENHVDVALRWSHYLGDWDIGLAHFSGTAREPRLVPAFDAAGNIVLAPHYDQLDQTSLDLQATKGSWLFKLELAARDERFGRSTGAVGGFEYTLVGIFDSAVDLGLIAEYLFDDAPASSFDNDLALGFRLAFNDTQSTDLLAFAGIDADTQATFASIEGSRRVGQNYRLNLESRLFFNIPPTDLLFDIRDDDFFQLTFSRFF